MAYTRNPDGSFSVIPNQFIGPYTQAQAAGVPMFPTSFAQAAAQVRPTPGQYRPTVNGTIPPGGPGLAAATKGKGNGAPGRSLVAPSTTTQSPRVSRYTTSADGLVRSRDGQRVDSLGNRASGGIPAPLPQTTGAMGGLQDPLAPTSLGGFIGAAYGGYAGAGNIVGPTGYNAFQQYIPGYDTGVGSLYGQSEQDFARTLAIGNSGQFWAELQQQDAQFQAQLRETILNNRRSQLLANIGVSGRNAAPTSRLDIS